MKPKFEDSHIPSSPDAQPELYRGVSEFMQNFSPSTQRVKEILSRESLDAIWRDGAQLTLLDLYSTDAMSRENIISIIKNRLWLNNIQGLNEIWKKSMQFCRFLYRTPPSEIEYLEWQKMDDFIDFVMHHTQGWNTGRKGIFICGFLKILLVAADLHQNQELIQGNTREFESKIKELSSNKHLKKTIVDTDGIQWYKYSHLWGEYEFGLEGRPKSWNSIMLKEIYNREYSSIFDFADLKAFRFHIKPQRKVENIAAIRDLFYGNDALLRMKQKWCVVAQEDIAALKRKKIDIAGKPPKIQSSIAYADLKSIDDGFEVQIVLEDNANERNFSSHTIYDLKKIIAANARLFGPLTLNSLWYILEHYRPEWLGPQNQFDFHRVSLFSHLIHAEQSGSAFLTVFKRSWKYYFIPREILFVQGDSSRDWLRDIYSQLPKNFEMYDDAEALNRIMFAMNSKNHISVIDADKEYSPQELTEAM